MEVRPISPVLGAELFGVSLADGVDDHTFEAIHRAFLDHGVLVFRNQRTLPPDVQVAVAERFGPLHTHPAAPTADQHPAIFVIHAHRDSRVANGNGWHSDVSCDPEPPMATMLQIQRPPAGGGGDTLFASMEAAWATLPETWRAQLRPLSARHESEHIYRGRYADRGVDDADVVYPASVHPVVRTHPETGRPSLYINRSFTTALVDVDPEESSQLLRRLFNHVERPEFQIRLRWEENDVALWDNRCLQHFAIWDYWPEERKGHRVSIHGDRPYFDPAAPDAPSSPIRMSLGPLAEKPRTA
ncbi:MAG: TauD/TfdA family dioxygenase [Actinomycetota bacterium]